ncbi:DER1-domain-containing protein [Fomitopsis serialis]|uniref:DER1-domain-containing protein n=1 Tax=Fomitopsis serialis TaxID=139415 RepID=UPI002008C565|nr:DER1-domain-containing protein [Neoantrodia serialis]KAH9917332.1 DER1-domain-containing protein [Neoantrodia serialis]
MSLWNEIQKVPSVTRFLCGASLAVTVPVLLESVSPYLYFFARPLVTDKFEIWRVVTTFFIGPFGIGYIFHFAMLYRHSEEVETSYYRERSADYAWQLLQVCISILLLNLPLQSTMHHRPLLIALVYLTSRLASPDAQTSFFGLITIPVFYLPYVYIGMDLLMEGRAGAAKAISGAIIGHLWWWGVWESRILERYGSAPAWLKKLLGQSSAPSAHGGWKRGGVEGVPPRQVREEGRPGEHRWGSGNRLGQ